MDAPAERDLLLRVIRNLHHEIVRRVVAACEEAESAASSSLSEVSEETSGDTIYAIDRVSEELIVEWLEREIAPHFPIAVVAEGLHEGYVTLPRGVELEDTRWQILFDPIDGTRGLMYQKRSAWVLTGVAPKVGNVTCLEGVELAVQTEIPLLKQFAYDSLWATRGGGAHAERHDRFTGESRPLALRPSTAETIEHGFASISRFFPGARDVLAEIDDEIVESLLGPIVAGKARCFEDQYVSTGGQLYELIVGHDRFVADLRPLMENVLAKRGLQLGLCCHPYDLATELIAREVGVVVTDPLGNPLRAPFDVDEDVAWVGYANEAIRQRVEPELRRALERRGLLEELARQLSDD